MARKRSRCYEVFDYYILSIIDRDYKYSISDVAIEWIVLFVRNDFLFGVIWSALNQQFLQHAILFCKEINTSLEMFQLVLSVLMNFIKHTFTFGFGFFCSMMMKMISIEWLSWLDHGDIINQKWILSFELLNISFLDVILVFVS